MEHAGPLLALVTRLREQGVGALRRRVVRIGTELGLADTKGGAGAGGKTGPLVLAALVASANAHLGVVAPAGQPLCKQVEHLMQVVGVRDD